MQSTLRAGNPCRPHPCPPLEPCAPPALASRAVQLRSDAFGVGRSPRRSRRGSSGVAQARPRGHSLRWPPSTRPSTSPEVNPPPHVSRLGRSPGASSAVNPTTRVLLVGRSPGACAGAPAVWHSHAHAGTLCVGPPAPQQQRIQPPRLWVGRFPGARAGAPPLRREQSQ
jgi:hypothetical protein